jgi:hypothetical protein
VIQKAPTITIWGRGAKFELTASDYIVKMNDKDGCIYGLGGGDIGFMLFGDVFMRKYGVVYDKGGNKMGLSK